MAKSVAIEKPVPPRQELANRGKDDFRIFIREAWKTLEPGTPLLWNWHIDAIAEHLQALYNRQITRLIIGLSPGHAKSTIVSQMFPVWCWVNDPYGRWLCASHSLDLALRDNVYRRRLIESDWFQANYGSIFQFAGDQNVKSFFQNDKAGYMMALAVRGSGTGKRATALLIDDANNAMAGKADQEATVEWHGKTWTSRINDQERGMQVVVGQRLGEEDLINHLLKQGGWEHLCLPEEFESARRCRTSIGWVDPRTEDGQLLWPKKFPKHVLDNLKQGFGSMNYAAQYGQSPVPASGGTFQDAWKRYFEIDGEHYILHTKYGRRKPVSIRSCRNEAVCDLATSERDKADFFVIQVWAITPENECLLLHQVRGHFNNPDQQKRAIETYERYALVKFHVEKVAYQLAYIQQLRNYEIKEEIEPNVYRVVKVVSIPVVPWTPFRDKEVRASVAAVKMEAGDMYWLQGASYLPDLEPEIFTFPKSKKKDQVDCHSMIADILSSPHGPAMWSVDSNESVSISPERAPSSGKPIPSIFEDKGIIEVDEEELEEWE